MDEIQAQYHKLAEKLVVSLREAYSLPAKATDTANVLVSYATSLRMKGNSEAFKVDQILEVGHLLEQPKNITQNDFNVLKELLTQIKSRRSFHLEQQTTSLRDVFERLSLKSRAALVDGDNQLDDFHQYLHVKRPIEDELAQVLQDVMPQSKKTLTFIVGNVGDGKSHLLSYERAKYPTLFQRFNIQVHNDATESHDPQLTALETLTARLAGFSDDAIDMPEQEHLIVAINMGVLVSLAAHLRKVGGFTTLLEYLNHTKILVQPGVTSQIAARFQLLTFHDSAMVKFSESGVTSDFFRALLSRITAADENNPFWVAYQENRQMQTMVVRNYELLCRPSVQQALEQLIVRIQVQYNQIISTRMLLNFVHDIVIPPDAKDDFSALLPMLLFSSADRSQVLKYVAKLDPTLSQNQLIDQYNSRIFNTLNYRRTCETIFAEEGVDFTAFNAYFTNVEQYSTSDMTFHQKKVQCLIRTLFVLKPTAPVFNQPAYQGFLNALANPMDTSILDLIYSGLLRWNGQVPDFDYTYTSRSANNMAIKLDPQFDEDKRITRDGYTVVVYLLVKERTLRVVINYDVYELLCKMQLGYVVRDVDVNRCVEFDRVVQRYIQAAMSKDVIIRHESTGTWIKIQSKWGQYKVEVHK